MDRRKQIVNNKIGNDKKIPTQLQEVTTVSEEEWNLLLKDLLKLKLSHFGFTQEEREILHQLELPQYPRPTIAQIKEIILSKNEQKLIELCSEPYINLRSLHLKGYPIGLDEATALSQTLWWFRLESLDLSNATLYEEAAEILFKESSWTNREILNLLYNRICVRSTEALSKDPFCTNLSRLTLENNQVGSKGAVALSKNIYWKNLTTLNLSWNNSIGDEEQKHSARISLGRN